MKKLVGILAAVLFVVSVFAAPVTLAPYVEGSVTGSVGLSNDGLTTDLVLDLDDISWGFSVEGLAISLSVDLDETDSVSVSKLAVANYEIAITWYSEMSLDPDFGTGDEGLGWFPYFDNAVEVATMILDIKALNLSFATQNDKVAVKAVVPVLDGDVTIASQITTDPATLTAFDAAALEVKAVDLLEGLCVGAGVTTPIDGIALDTLDYYGKGSYEYAVPADGMAITVTPRGRYSNTLTKYVGVNLDLDADAYFANLDVLYTFDSTDLTVDLEAGLDGYVSARANMSYTEGDLNTVQFLVVSDDITVYGPVSVAAKVGSGYFGDADWGDYDESLQGDLTVDATDISANLTISVNPDLGLDVFTATYAEVYGSYWFGAAFADEPYEVGVGFGGKLYDLLDIDVSLDVLPEFNWSVIASYTVSF